MLDKYSNIKYVFLQVNLLHEFLAGIAGYFISSFVGY